MQKKNRDYFVAGIDEAGRGPLAGPVYAAAVILHSAKPIPKLTDSKLLSSEERDVLFELIYASSLSVGIGRAEVEEIDSINILQATFLAMRRALANLSLQPCLALVDGNQNPKLECETKLIIKGDLSEPAISAASIVAKVSRDREMIRLDREFPHYGFAKHKGYSTKQHMAALREHGPCYLHRHSFAPVKLCASPSKNLNLMDKALA